MFICTECGQNKKNSEKVFCGVDYHWCRPCVTLEDSRSKSQDIIKGFIQSRPRKYMLDPKDYKIYGY
ncbi:MAG: hypothetical protein AABY22_05530 [Nanoarchaeota archaeon]